MISKKWLVGSLSHGQSLPRDFCAVADRIGYANAEIVETERKPSSQHQTPLRLSLGNRLIYDAYLRSEFGTAFREDLLRPMGRHATDRLAAFDRKR